MTEPTLLNNNHFPEDDKFATLFSPPTPRPSPGCSPRSLTPILTTTIRPATLHKTHSRTPSSSHSDFGSFVAVPATEDPLGGVAGAAMPFTPIQNVHFFDRFGEDAKAATEKNKKGLLDELLNHEDDPLYWLKPSNEEVLGAAEQRSSSPGEMEPEEEAKEPVVDVETQAAQAQEDLLDLTTSLDTIPEFERGRSGSHPERKFNLTESAVSGESSESISPERSLERSPPPSPRLLRARSSTLSTSSMSTKWISSLLTAPRPYSAILSPKEHDPVGGLFASTSSDGGGGGGGTPPTQVTPESSQSWNPPSSLPHIIPHVKSAVAQIRQASLSASLPVQHPLAISGLPSPSTQTSAPLPLPIPSRSGTITHGSPFAAQSYIPPSGAPGFKGDREWNKNGFEFGKEDRVDKKSLRLVGRKEVTTPVLTVELADTLRTYLPALSRLPRSWSLLYSLDQHGISLKTLYNRCESHLGGALVVVRDSGDGTFGAWVGEGVRLSKGAYYGGGESFLWKVKNGKVVVYRWAGKNDYVALCEQDYISFGGGEGRYGLYLDDTLLDGSSARCSTFENEPLCSRGPRQGEAVRFECVGLEVWGMGV
ncbi:hypothetical protein JAAARDRAFT_62966 [Jaapia argillacea MUCL 33604]|uniref:Oxidation resistance protein 1 n=1 Tax=Jaapia argillacea MUCL 33604 TaxID=933084 RepID=A0A067PK27_9AGAM|nr:hypothetical protein JAAARDRAFT_62966 [Jaapia argillacea MUCL 33604]